MEPRDVGLWVVGEAAPQPAVGGRGWFSGGGPRADEVKNVSAFCVFVFVLPLARCCCCLWAMEVLVLLLHCLLTRASFFF